MTSRKKLQVGDPEPKISKISKNAAPNPTRKKLQVVAVDCDGRRIGEHHPNASLTDWEVDLMRTIHEREGWGYNRLARVFEIPKATVQSICNYRYRSRTVAGTRQAWVRSTKGKGG